MKDSTTQRGSELSCIIYKQLLNRYLEDPLSLHLPRLNRVERLLKLFKLHHVVDEWLEVASVNKLSDLGQLTT